MSHHPDDFDRGPDPEMVIASMLAREARECEEAARSSPELAPSSPPVRAPYEAPRIEDTAELPVVVDEPAGEP
jgi:hypothetical protein